MPFPEDVHIIRNRIDRIASILEGLRQTELVVLGHPDMSKAITEDDRTVFRGRISNLWTDIQEAVARHPTAP